MSLKRYGVVEEVKFKLDNIGIRNDRNLQKLIRIRKKLLDERNNLLNEVDQLGFYADNEN